MSVHIVHFMQEITPIQETASIISGTAAAFDPWQNVLRFCASLSPRIEPYQGNEAFVDLTGTADVKQAVQSLLTFVNRSASRTRCRHAALRIAVTLAPNKFVARIGSLLSLQEQQSSRCSHAKQFVSNVLFTEIAQADVLSFLAPLSVRYVWSVDQTVRQRLQTLGIATFQELRQVPRSRLVNTFGIDLGYRLSALAQGIDHTPVVPLYPQETVEVYHEIDGEHALNDATVISALIARLASALSEQLQASSKACSSLSLRLVFRDGEQSRSLKLRHPTVRADVIENAAHRLLQHFTLNASPYRLHLIAGDLDMPRQVQHGLFAGPRRETERRGDKVLAYVHKRLGAASLQYAKSLLPTRREQMRALWYDTIYDTRPKDNNPLQSKAR